MKKLLSGIISILLFVTLAAQNVGIGTVTPFYKLDIGGDLHTTGSTYVDGFLGIGTTAPVYKFQVTNGPIAIYNTADSKAWYFNYTPATNRLVLSEDGIDRVVVENGGDVGIGTSTPVAKLDVAGSAVFSGNVTVNSNKGIIRNATSTQLRYYTRQQSFVAVLPAFGTSPEGIINFDGGFTNPPVVYVGDLVATGGPTGPLYRCQLQIYNVTATNCRCRIINTSNAAIDQSFTWNIICIGN